jgi:hypothetical protein
MALWACLELVEGAVATGRGAAAHAHADAMIRHRLAEISPRLALVTHSCAAMAADEDREAVRLFDRALSVPAADRWVFDYARVQLLYAQRLRRIRASRESRHHLLRSALAAFENAGAQPWADRAARELRAVGLSRTSRATRTSRSASGCACHPARSALTCTGSSPSSASPPEPPSATP